MSKTVVGLFKSTAAAQEVKQILVSGRYQPNQVSIVSQDHDDAYSTSSSNTGVAAAGSKAVGVGEKIGNFFSGLVGGDEDVHHHYATGVNQGGALLTVKTDDADTAEVVALLKQHGARDIEGDTQSVAASGKRDYADDSARELTGETAIPIVEEELVVGKREVDRGGVCVYSHVTERPVEADVTLRDERINVERRPVNRPATAADFNLGKESSFELRASGEEAVVGKNSRVVEEVMIGKQATEHIEAVRDTVRKTEVDVEQIPGEVTEKTNRY